MKKLIGFASLMVLTLTASQALADSEVTAKGSWCSVLPELKRTTVTTPPTEKADFILVDKANRKMYLWADGSIIRTYSISLGSSPKGHKVKEGDGKTPEGRYRITHKNPRSQYHLSLGISYPNKKDREEAEELGVEPGGNIMIHGFPNDEEDYLFFSGIHGTWDWTRGCIAVTNEEIEEIYSAVDAKTEIEICP